MAHPIKIAVWTNGAPLAICHNAGTVENAYRFFDHCAREDLDTILVQVKQGRWREVRRGDTLPAEVA